MYEDVTPETIEAAILEKITEFDTREGSFTRSLVARRPMSSGSTTPPWKACRT